jgi:integrase
MSVWQHERGGWYLQIKVPGGSYQKLYIGKMAASQAKWLNERVLELQRCRTLAMPHSTLTAQWVTNLEGPVRTWLVNIGLLDDRKPKRDLTLVQWFTEYLESRTDYKKNTLKGWGTAKKHVVLAFPTARMDEINAFQAHTFARDLSQKVSSEHASKIVERVNQLFEAAIQAELITKNPFSGVQISAKRDKSREFYVDSALALSVQSHCKLHEARAIFALARWCGLRVPHEPLALEWTHIDFVEGRIRVPDATKTGFRILPLFPNARTPLEDLRSKVPLDQIHVIDRARLSAGTTWRSWILSAIDSAGKESWPKLFHNLRASCRTDLEERFESHVCDVWLGHSTQVAKDHYLMVKPNDWTKAQEAEA